GPTIERMSNHFATLLRAIAASPSQRVCELPILEEAERRQLLFEWSRNRVGYPRPECVHALFESQAQLCPEAIAAGIDDAHLTYGELDRRSNQLARYLIALGVELEQVVGICADRGPDLVLCLLGVLKAGAAFLPLDPSYPAERLAYMLNDAAARVV